MLDRDWARWTRVVAVCASALVLLRVALPGRAAAGTFACTSGSNCTMSFTDGPVMHRQRIVLVDWGNYVPDFMTGAAYSSSNYLTAGNPGYIRSLVALNGTTSDVAGITAQYADSLGPGGSGANAANHFSYLGQYKITNPTYGPGSSSATVTDTQIQAQLDASIHAGTLPQPTKSDTVQVGSTPSSGLHTTYGTTTLYVVQFPPNDVISQGGADSVTGFCAYHNTFQSSYLANTDIVYAVMPSNNGNYDAGAGCGPDTSANAAINNETDVLGHEIGESITDPLIGLDTSYNYAYPAAWGNNANGEVGDTCTTGSSTAEQALAGPAGAQWVSQALWSNVDHACATSESAYGQPTAAITAPTSPVAGTAASFSASGSHDPSSNTISSNNGLSLPSAIGPGLASYSWTWGDGSSGSTGASPSHTYATAGTYAVTLTVTDDLGFKGSISRSVTVGSSTSSGSGGGSTSSTPTAVTTAPRAVGRTSAILAGTVSAAGESVSHRFVWGTSATSLSHSTALSSGPTGTTAEAVSAAISGLSPNHTYYYRVVASTSTNTYRGAVVSFRTRPRKPGVAIRAARAVGHTTAVVRAFVNPHGVTTRYYLQYWLKRSHRLSSPLLSAGSGWGFVRVSTKLASLLPGRRYHYRVVAVSRGGTARSSTRAFRTRRGTAHLAKLKFSVPRGQTLTHVRARGLVVRFHCSASCRVSFSAVRLSRRHGVQTITVASRRVHVRGRLVHRTRLRLTRAGRRLLRTHRSVRLAVIGSVIDRRSSLSYPVSRHVRLRPGTP